MGAKGAKKALIALGVLVVFLVVVVFVQSGDGDDTAAAPITTVNLASATDATSPAAAAARPLPPPPPPPPPPPVTVGAPSQVLVSSVLVGGGSFDPTFLEALRTDVAAEVNLDASAVTMPAVLGAHPIPSATLAAAIPQLPQSSLLWCG